MPTEFSLGVTSVAFCNRRPRLDFRCTPSATKFARHCNMSRRARSGRETPREPGGGAVSWLSSRGMRTGTTNRVRLHSHSAPRPGLTNACGRTIAIAVPATVKTSAMTRSVLDLRHMKSMSIVPGGLMCGALWRASTWPANSRCARTTLVPSCSGFTIGHVRGIIGHVRHQPPAKDHLRRHARALCLAASPPPRSAES
jgi:hypothetical protein